MEDAAASSPATPTSILVCREDGNDAFPDADDGADFSFGRDDRPLVVDHDDEYFALLLSKERASADAGAPTEEMADWIKAARSGCVRWIIKTASTFRFGGKTAYVAVTYYDRFLAQQKIERGNEWGVHLLAVTCLSLAAKVEYRRPTRRLSEFRLDAYAFGSSDIMRMELLVLAKLQWHMITVTPFAFISCFAARFRRDERRAIIVRAAECVFDAIKVMSSVEYKPSTIALASILVARNKATSASSLDELKTILGSSWPQLDTGRVHSCYSTMIQEDELSLHSPEMASSGVSVAADVGVSSLPAAEDALAGNPNEPRGMATEAVSQDSKATRPRKLNPRYYGSAWLNK